MSTALNGLQQPGKPSNLGAQWKAAEERCLSDGSCSGKSQPKSGSILSGQVTWTSRGDQCSDFNMSSALKMPRKGLR